MDDGFLGSLGIQVVIDEDTIGEEGPIQGSVPILSLLRGMNSSCSLQSAMLVATAGTDRTISNKRLAARSGQWDSRQLLSMLRNPEMGDMLSQAIGDDDEMDDAPWGRFLRRRRRAPKDPNRFPKVPSDKGTELMRSGGFGSNQVDQDRRAKKVLARRLMERELGLGSGTDRRRNSDLITQVWVNQRPCLPNFTLFGQLTFLDDAGYDTLDRGQAHYSLR